MVADLFHAGHVSFLRKARELAEERAGARATRLVVGVHDDATVASYKRMPVLSMPERIAVVEACRYVDEVIAGAPLEVDLPFLEAVGADLVVHGDDFSDAQLEACYGAAIALGIFATVPYTHTVDGDRELTSTAILARARGQSRSLPPGHST